MTRALDDFNAWDKWNKSKKIDNLQELHTQMHPLIMREVSKWKGTIAPEVLEMEARGLAQKAFETYDPARNVALGTHVANGLQKLSRINYQYQNPARLPEHRQVKFHTFHYAKINLENDMWREPTLDDMSDSLGWNKKEVWRMNQEIRKDFTESVPVTSGVFFNNVDHDPMIDFYYHDLSPEDKLIFESTTGYGGKKILNMVELQKLTKLTQSQLSYRKAQIRKFIDAH